MSSVFISLHAFPEMTPKTLPDPHSSQFSKRTLCGDLGEIFSEIAILSSGEPLPPGWATLTGIRLNTNQIDQTQRPAMIVNMTPALRAFWTERASGMFSKKTFDADTVPLPEFHISRRIDGMWFVSLNPPSQGNYPTTPFTLAQIPQTELNNLMQTLQADIDVLQLKHQFPELAEYTSTTDDKLNIIHLKGLRNHVITGQLKDGALHWPDTLPMPDDHLTIELNPDAPQGFQLEGRGMANEYRPTSEVLYIPLYSGLTLHDAKQAIRMHEVIQTEPFLEKHHRSIQYALQGAKPLMRPLDTELVKRINDVNTLDLEPHQKTPLLKELAPGVICDDLAEALLVMSPAQCRPNAPTLLSRCEKKAPGDAVFDIMDHITLYNTSAAYKQGAVGLSVVMDNTPVVLQPMLAARLREFLPETQFDTLTQHLHTLHKRAAEPPAYGALLDELRTVPPKEAQAWANARQQDNSASSRQPAKPTR